MIKGQEQNQNLIEDRLPIRTEDKKRKTSLKENKFFQGLKGKAVRNTFFAFLTTDLRHRPSNCPFIDLLPIVCSDFKKSRPCKAGFYFMP